MAPSPHRTLVVLDFHLDLILYLCLLKNSKNQVDFSISILYLVISRDLTRNIIFFITTTMFRRLWSGLPPDAKFPSDLKGLGFVYPSTLYFSSLPGEYTECSSSLPSLSNGMS